ETTTTTDGMMDIATDIGVDLEAGVIKVGLLSDLTGAFGPLVSAIVAGHEAYWAEVNANGGINGLMVELEVVDTVYDVTNHVQFFNELKDEVVAFGHSTGSPHTVAINADLQAQGILAIPLTWYSGWSDPAINSNLVPHGTPYCIESMNLIEYMVDQSGLDSPTIAIASIPGDYGLDSAAGAALAAAALGLDVVYDGTGKLIPGDDASTAEVAGDIVAADPDLVYLTATPGAFSATYGAALATGFEATWSGAAPSWNPAFVAEGSPIRDAIARDFIGSFYADTWNGESAGAQHVTEVMSAAGAPPTDYYGEGFVEATILHRALQVAYDNGDMTQAGVLAAAKSLETVDFDGLAPSESYVGEPNDIVQRQINILRPDLDAPTGSMIVEYNYTSPTAAAYEFTEACYKLEG
ncbi:MAG: ABC transporter substrate-binding protein, partial [Acidimicrobiia bacterium]|nr:ABC transporter substrate-binding protein [Acidimicrobiia bacterium]